MNENDDWVTIRVTSFFKTKFNWHYIEPARLSLLEKLLRKLGFVDVFKINVKTSEVKCD